ncbi:hypothetical protein Trydic_g14902 [Trypoxylus dichotomus]
MKGDISLSNFFIFNSTYGSNEGEEHKKILYYYPEQDDLDAQIKNIGLVEAIIQFTSTFKPSCPVNSLHTQKKRQLYFQPEESFWMVMTLSTPFIDKTKDGTPTREYIENDIQDNVYEAVLRQTYAMYKLFNGTFNSSLQKSDIPALKSKLEKFYTTYLKSLKLTHCDILSIFNGIQFLPLDKQNFLNVQCFLNEIECDNSIIDSTLFMFNEHVIWSGLEPDDLQTLYQYLVHIFLPSYMETELQGGSMPRNPSSPFTLYHGRFINGPPNLKTAKSVGKFPKIYLTKKRKPALYSMLIYRTLSATVCLFIEDEKEISLQFLRELDESMGTKLSPIVSAIAEYCSQQISTVNSLSEYAPRFIYFNKMNLAYKSTTHLDNKQTGNLACPRDSMKIIADMNSRKASLDYAGDVIVKTMNDYWVVGRLSNLREFYITIQQKNANLIDISEEMKKLCDAELKGIFFHEL